MPTLKSNAILEYVLHIPAHMVYICVCVCLCVCLCVCVTNFNYMTLAP